MAKEPKKEKGRSHEERKGKKNKKEGRKTALTSSESKKKRVDTKEESVILMGPAYTEEESAMQSISDILPEQDLFEEETQNYYGEQPTVVSEVHHHKNRKKHRAGTFRFVLGIIFIFVGLAYLAGNLGLFTFNTVDAPILEFWPLILIFFGLFVVYSERLWGKIMGIALALLIIGTVFSVLLNDGRIISEQLSGDIIEEKREVGLFTSVALLGAGNLVIKQGKEVSLIVKADASVIDKIKAEVLDGQLHLSFPRSLMGRLFFRTAAPTYLVTVIDLTAIRLTGSGSVQSTDINVDKLELSIIGSGNVEVNNIEAREINVSLSGSGGYTLSGTTTRQIIHILGSGSYNAGSLISREAGVRIIGSGEVLVNVEGELNAAVNGSGMIGYIGDPFVSEEKVEGSGTIVKVRSGVDVPLLNLEILEQLKKIDAVKYPKIEQI